MIYAYPMKRCSLLAKKMQEFYKDVSKKRAGKMWLQADGEFQQTKIKQLNKEYNVDMYSTNLRGGKAFAAEWKIRELKTCFQEVKEFKNHPRNALNQMT